MKRAATSARLAAAFAFAERLYRRQFRKRSTVPYATHLMSVAALVGESGGDEDEMIAALLHDGPEDQGGRKTLAAIRRRFGPRVARIVAGCSDTFESPKPPWSERKRAYLRHLRTASASVRLVSAADKVHNARAILADLRRGVDVWAKFNAGRDDQLKYYRALVREFRARGPRGPAEELARLVSAF